MEKGIKELPTMEILQFFLIPYMPTIKSALVCMLESVCLSHCWTKCDCLLSIDGNFLIATHCQKLIALDANEFLAAKKDAWSLSKVVRTPGSEFKHDTDQSPWNPGDLFSSMQIAFATSLCLSWVIWLFLRQSVSIIGGIISRGLDHIKNWLSLVICIQCRHAFVAATD